MKFSLFYSDIHPSTQVHLCFTIVIEYSLGALILSYYFNNILTYSLGFGISMCRTD